MVIREAVEETEQERLRTKRENQREIGTLQKIREKSKTP